VGIEFRRAARDGVGLFVAIAGGGRTGKTYTALRIAQGIAGPAGRIAAIDTEGRRMSHYSDAFAFDVYNMQSPFSPARFSEAAYRAQDAGYAVMVIDSFSLEWAGIGGVLDLHEQELARLGGSPSKSDIAWAAAKRPHKAMVNALLQLTMPVVFCLRAKPVAEHLAEGRAGAIKPVQDKDLFFEWTVALTLHPDTPGQPRYDLKMPDGSPAFKVQEQHRHIFPPGQVITEEAGRLLQEWRNSDAARTAAPPPPEAHDDDAPRRRSWSQLLTDIAKAADLVVTAAQLDALRESDDVALAMDKGADKVRERVQALLADTAARLPSDDIFPGDPPSRMDADAVTTTSEAPA